MNSLTNAETALLALLAEQPMHPYKIEQEVRERDMRFWTELSMSSIYKLLRKLEKEGQVDSENLISTENRVQKQYSITGIGKERLTEKIAEILSTPEHIRWQFDIGIYNSDLLPVSSVRDALLRYLKKLRENIDGYRALQEYMKNAGCPVHRLTVAIRPMYLIEAEIRWIDDYLKELDDKSI